MYAHRNIMCVDMHICMCAEVYIYVFMQREEKKMKIKSLPEMAHTGGIKYQIIQ